MSSNQSLLQKADLELADLQSGGGELSPEQGNSFIRKLIKEPTLIRRARVVEMLASQRKINKIGFGSRILRKALSGVALTEAQRSKPTTSQVVLNTEEQIAEVRIPYDVMEDNIERALSANNEASNSGPSGLRQTIIDLIAERAALDLEELLLLADTAYTNAGDADDEAYLSQFDGWLKLAETNGNVSDVAGAAIDKTMFKNGKKLLPSQYQRNLASLHHLVSVNQETDYRDTLADRQTGLGDTMVQGANPVMAGGSPVTPVPMMPETEGLYTHPLNLIFGIQRQVSMEFDKNISTREYIIVLTCRIACEIEEAEAMVKYENILAA